MTAEDKFDFYLISLHVDYRHLRHLHHYEKTTLKVKLTEETFMDTYNLFISRHLERRNQCHDVLSFLPQDITGIIDSYLPLPSKTLFDPQKILYQDETIEDTYQAHISYFIGSSLCSLCPGTRQVFSQINKCNVKVLFSRGDFFHFTTCDLKAEKYMIKICPVYETQE